MRPLIFIRRFLRREEGAVTVDWVVLTGGILIFGIVAASLIAQGATEGSSSVGAVLGEGRIPELDFDGS
jgi:hypothetical protein